MEELAQRLQQLEEQLGQQRAVIEHQQDQLMHQPTAIDADRAARTPVLRIARNTEEIWLISRLETVGHSKCVSCGEARVALGWNE